MTAYTTKKLSKYAKHLVHVLNLEIAYSKKHKNLYEQADGFILGLEQAVRLVESWDNDFQEE